jgi:lipopolysaccharide export system protein LptA
MACKFHAAMRNPLLFAFVAAFLAPPVAAEKADRNKPLTLESDQPGSFDLLKQVLVLNGNVVVSQGSLVMRADRVEVHQGPDGFRSAVALGSASRPASFRQKRDGVDEHIEGAAERIEYDGRSDVVRFVGKASVRRLRGGAAADELTGNVISYDNTSEVFSVQGGPSNVSAANPTGRVRAVLTPREDKSAATAPAASAALKPSPALGDKP